MDSFYCAGFPTPLLLVAGAMFALGGSRGKNALEEARRPHGLVGSKPEPVPGVGPGHAGDGSGDVGGVGTSYFAAPMVSAEVSLQCCGETAHSIRFRRCYTIDFQTQHLISS